MEKIDTVWAEINLDNIKFNYRNIRERLKKDVLICGVVKANAYGHGAIDVARILEDEGANYLAVARLEEAIELRKNGISVPILCLGYIPKENYRFVIKYNITVTVCSLESAICLNELAKAEGVHIKIHIKIDTGMGRLGFLLEEDSLEDIVEVSKLSNLTLEGIYTHFAKADEEDKQYTMLQVDRFNKINKELDEKGVKIPIKHVSNSAAIIEFEGLNYNMVRCGIALYGHYPSNEIDRNSISLKPVMTLKTRIAHIKQLKCGDPISYGGKYTTYRDTNIATMPIGYADGFFRTQKSPQVAIKGELYDVVGRICMDQCMVDLGKNEAGISVDDEVVVFGEQEGLNVEDIALDVETINYEILCSVSRRVERVYIEGKYRTKRNYLLD